MIHLKPLNKIEVASLASFLLIFFIGILSNAEVTLWGCIFFFSWLFIVEFCKEYLPVIFLLAIWFVPGQTATGGLLADYQVFRWVTHIAIPSTVAYYFVRDFLRKKRWDLSPFFLPIGLIFFTICISGIYNQSNPLDFVSCLLIYLRYPLLFLLLINWDIKDTSLERVVPCFLALTLLQIPEVFIRALVFGIRGDAISFSLGPWGSFNLGIYFLYTSAFITAHAITAKIKWYHILMMATFLLIAGLGEIKALWFFFAPVIFSVYLTERKGFTKSITRLLVLLFIGGLGLYIVFQNWDTLTQGQTNALYKLTSFIKGLLQGKKLHELPWIFRIEQINIVAYLLVSSLGNLFIGFGPGSSLAGNFSGNPGVIASTLNWLIWRDVTMIQWVTLAGDIGIVGLLSFVFLFFRIATFAFQFSSDLSNPKWAIYANAFSGIFVFYALLGPFYNIVWRFDGSNFIMWTLLAILYRKYSKQRSLHFSPIPLIKDRA